MGADMNEATAFKDASHIWLFGLKAGKDKFASVMQEGSICKAYVHPILPGLGPCAVGHFRNKSGQRAGLALKRARSCRHTALSPP